MAEREDDFGGAHLPRNPPEATWVCVAQALSPGQDTLVRVYVSTLGYRVQQLKKTGAPKVEGLWWSEAAPPVAVASREEALQLMTTLSS